MPLNPTLQEFVARTPVIDTHEHIIEESRRLAPPSGGRYPCDDWALLFMHYAANDLTSAGLPSADASRIFGNELGPSEKWALFEPYYSRARNTGYLQAARISIRELYGEEDIHAGSVERITDKMRALVRKGYYYTVLRDTANVESCQVNSLEHIFCETEYPDLLMQDLSFVAMSTGLDLAIARRANIAADTLEDWHRVIDWYFEQFGARAVAVKNQSAYGRRLNYAQVSAADAAPLFVRHARGQSLAPDEMKALQDHLFHYCVSRATDYDLPVKLHTGYYAGANGMPLERLRQNAGDLCPVLQAHPRARFVLMHIGYPYQDEFVALAKHYTNAYVDMCWAWIINPAASVRFLKEALTGAPASKVLAFGGDYITVETAVGHARIARRGIALALSELVDEGWLSESDALDAAYRVMYGNARELFTPERRLKAWQ
jgi:hypothetical protein